MRGICCKMKIIILFSSLLVSVNSLNCDLKFECVNDTVVNIEGTNFSCKNGLVCNRDTETSCDACIKKPPSCPFKCKGDSVNFNGIIIECDDNFVCNQSPEDDCTACVRRKCNPEIKQYTCDAKDDALVTIGSYRISCNQGYKCNKEYVYPCDPCISRDENLKQPFVQATNVMPIGIQPKSLQRAILVPDEEMINCNDGKSFLQPCRPGVEGSNYYFKCTLSWNLRYSTSIKPCTSLYSDMLCRKVQDLCLPVG